MSYTGLHFCGTVADDQSIKIVAMEESVHDPDITLPYTICAVVIFAIVSYTFLFPLNRIITLDRRTVAVLGSTLCYVTRSFAFPGSNLDIVSVIDFDVLVLLASIMAINHIVVHLRETKSAILWIQNMIQADPKRGFWMVSLATFLVAPFLTNDGVCLLFVEIILSSFENIKPDLASFDDEEELPTENEASNGPTDEKLELRRSDAIYFLLSLACSSNIGSALTYTGNPQNMIVSQDAVDVMSPGKFLLYMLLPSTLSWFLTTGWIYYTWQNSRNTIKNLPLQLPSAEESLTKQSTIPLINCKKANEENPLIEDVIKKEDLQNSPGISPSFVVIQSDVKDFQEFAHHHQLSSLSSMQSDLVHHFGQTSEIVEKGKIKSSYEKDDDDKSSCASASYISADYNYHMTGRHHLHSLQVPDNMATRRKFSSSTKRSQASKACKLPVNRDQFTVTMFPSIYEKSDPAIGKSSSVFKCFKRHREKEIEETTNPMMNPNSDIEKPALLSPRKQRMLERDVAVTNVVHIVSSPFPYMMVALLLAMIIMIFVDVISISGLVCITAVIMVVTLVAGNLWRGKEVWGEADVQYIESSPTNITAMLRSCASPAKKVLEHNTDLELGFESYHDTNQDTNASKSKKVLITNVHKPHELTYQDRLDSVNEFFDSLFESIDYSLLIIFLGTFIVVANIDSTGLPKMLWGKIVGDRPFNTASSIIGISLFVLISSQLLGNVAVIQLARPNIVPLSPEQRKLAWAVISFVATVGGNLTITGSAANIIVAEKAARLDPNSSLDFFSHYKVCFWVTLLSCFIGGAIVCGLTLTGF